MLNLGATLLGVLVWVGCLRLLLTKRMEESNISVDPIFLVRKEGKLSGQFWRDCKETLVNNSDRDTVGWQSSWTDMQMHCGNCI